MTRKCLVKSLVVVENRVGRVHGIWTRLLKWYRRFRSVNAAEIVVAFGSDDLWGRDVVPNVSRGRRRRRYLWDFSTLYAKKLNFDFKVNISLIVIFNILMLERTLWKLAGTALSGGGGGAEVKVCLVVGDVVVTLDEVHFFILF